MTDGALSLDMSSNYQISIMASTLLTLAGSAGYGWGMTTLPSAPDNDRRAALLEQLADLVQCGVDAEVASKKAKLDEMTVTPRAERIMRNRLAEVSHFRSVAFKDTMSMLKSYETDTLEHVAVAFIKEDKGRRKLHEWIPYNGLEWNRMSYRHRDAMFRDVLALRGFTSLKAEYKVHALLETYRALGLKPGSIHVMPFDEMHVAVAPVFLLATASRNIVWLRSGIKTKTTDSRGNFIPPVESKVHVYYTRDHLTPEAIEYVLGDPKRSTHLWEYMKRNSETLMEIDFELFLLKQETHPALAEGVL